ncbi:MAG: hypothetical protein CMJ16_03790 [Peredibacter sp.]|nr:hypothetical protein [Peredibacter sp.]
MKNLLITGLILFNSFAAYSSSSAMYNLVATGDEKNHFFLSACVDVEPANCVNIGPEEGIYIPALKNKLHQMSEESADLSSSIILSNGATAVTTLVTVASFFVPPAYLFWMPAMGVLGIDNYNKRMEKDILDTASLKLTATINDRASFGDPISAEDLKALSQLLSNLKEENSEIYANLEEYNSELVKFRYMDSPMSFVSFGKRYCGADLSEELLLSYYKKISEIEAENNFQIPRSTIKEFVETVLLYNCVNVYDA